MSKNHKAKEIVDLKRIRQKKWTVRVLYIVLSLFVVFTMVRSIIRGEYSNFFLCVLTLFLFILPVFIEQHFHLHIPNVLEGLILCFIFAAEILGEINCYYEIVPHWDTVLHTLNGFMCAAIGFCLLDLINRNPKIKFSISPVYLALVAFCFSMTVGVMWEFFEYGCDHFLATDMQKDAYVNSIHTVLLDTAKTNTPVDLNNIQSVIVNYIDANGNVQSQVLSQYIDIGIYDTMKDLFVNFIGAVVFSFIGFFYIKHRGKGKIASGFIPVIDEESIKKTPNE